MNFKEAFEAMKQGNAVKLPEWKGYWKIENGSIKMYCKNGSVLDIRNSEDMLYTITNINSNEWEVIGDTIPADLNIQTFSFGEAIRNLKKRKKVARKGWNGKGMYIILIYAGNSMYQGYDMQNCLGIKTTNNQMQPGWLPSQADLFAEDWIIVD